MIVRTALFALFYVVLVAFAKAQDDEKTDPLRDVQIGMQGLMQASQDPTMMAQLLQDMQVRSSARGLLD